MMTYDSLLFLVYSIAGVTLNGVYSFCFVSLFFLFCMLLLFLVVVLVAFLVVAVVALPLLLLPTGKPPKPPPGPTKTYKTKRNTKRKKRNKNTVSRHPCRRDVQIMVKISEHLVQSRFQQLLEKFLPSYVRRPLVRLPLPFSR